VVVEIADISGKKEKEYSHLKAIIEKFKK